MSNEPKVRYSDEELQEFKQLIEQRIAREKQELEFTLQQIAELNENGFNQQGGDWYDDSTAHVDLEMLQRMSMRQQKLLQDLQNALLRIHNKSYGICIVTGRLIDKNRLRIVPHATKSVDGKNQANSALPPRDSTMEGSTADPFSVEDDRPPAKPVSEKVRLTGGKRPPKATEEWESEGDLPEEPRFNGRKEAEDDES